MGLEFNISTLFELAFGIRRPVFYPETKPGTTNEMKLFSGISLAAQEQSERLSWMGTPIVFPFSLEGGVYKKFNDLGVLTEYPLEAFEMPAATLIDFTRSKTIVKTDVLGGGGTVKELYGFGDWKMRIRGLCLNDHSRLTAKTAEEQKKQLLNFEQVCGSVGVVGTLFHEKGIHQLVMDDINFRQLEGQPNVIPFEFSCDSDQPLELIL